MTRQKVLSTLNPWNSNSPAEQEAQLLRIAQHAEKSPEQIVMDGVSFLHQDEESFRLAVEQGLAEADAGNIIEEEEMDARFEKMMRR